MAEIRNWYLVAYDIRCPKRWRRIYKLMNGYGTRLQLSVFRCWLSPRDREKLRWQLEEILKPEDDILFVRLSQQCVRDLPQYNRANVWQRDEAPFRTL